MNLDVNDAPNVTNRKLREIASFLTSHDKETEVVIHIHGYNTRNKDFENWVKEIQHYINNDKFINQKKIVFIGYYWPSEYITLKSDNEDELISSHFGKAIRTLPIFFRTIYNYASAGLITTFAFILAILSLSISDNFSLTLSSFTLFLLAFGIAFFACLFGYVFCAILLRVSIYFRDNYRAVNYGVPDLVDFIRQIDNTIIEQTPGNTRDEKKWNFAQSNQPRIKLSFIAHSMGAFVTTNVIRVLSDIFDENSIPTLVEGTNQLQLQPSPNIGNVFSLGRLVIASPDIPIETIMPERSNFLRSSLRRFEESYLFSSQGDIILRVASTAANYISFPANTYDRGFRLGNAVVDSRIDTAGLFMKYGIVNQSDEDGSVNPDAESSMKQIGIVSDNRLKSLCDILSRNSKVTQNEAIAGLFTYFDCTDYKDVTNENDQEPKGILTRALRKAVLSFWDCLVLIFDNFVLGRNGHGGYFQGELSKKIIYRLAFLGFRDFLISLQDEPDYQEIFETIDAQVDREAVQTSLQSQGLEIDTGKETFIKLSRVLSQKCEDKGIKVFLAPERYLVDMLGKQRDRQGY
ncbi:MAG: alpha/beta hydrolase [Calothrix sp. C42_A2020_038]|nr:alpha/beta hydrolase [Calothrix sp. C42_A2020_038]